jgi:hypothetical protein
MHLHSPVSKGKLDIRSYFPPLSLLLLKLNREQTINWASAVASIEFLQPIKNLLFPPY